MKKKYILGTLGIIGTVVLMTVFIFNKSKGLDIADICIAFVGMIAVLWQISENNAISTGDFILELQKTYSENKKFVRLFEKCWAEYKTNECLQEENSNETERNIPVLINYLTFFESLYIMLKKGALDIKVIDNLFARRFFAVVNNRNVQETELVSQDNYKYYWNIFKLYSKWKKYRKEQEKRQRKINPYYEDELLCMNNENCLDLEKALEKLLKGIKLKN